MGETPQPVTASFNRSLRIESRVERLTGDPGAVLVREILERSGIVGWMAARLKDRMRRLRPIDLPLAGRWPCCVRRDIGSSSGTT